MRVAAAGEKTFGQRNDCCIRTGGFCWVRTRLTGREDDRIAKGALQPDSQRTREHELLILRPVLAECMISGILAENAAEIGLRTEDTGCDCGVDRVIASLRALQIIVALVANVAEAGFAHAHWQGKQRNLVGADVYVAGLHPAISKTISECSGFADRLLGLD